jgi:holo-ACP synthase CitX
MAPSSTPFDDCRREALSARDARQEATDRWRGVGATLVAFSLGVPGPRKVPPGALELFVWSLDELKRALPAARTLYVTRDALGPFVLWSTPGDAAIVKRRCIAVEASRPAARLLDIDVYSPEGTPIDRQSLQLPPRACLCCGEPARDCIRGTRHDPEDVVARAGDLLATFGA